MVSLLLVRNGFADYSDYDFEPTLHLLRFRIAHISLIQGSDRYNFSAKASWSPLFKLDETWALLPLIGLMPALINDKIVPVIELQFVGQYSFGYSTAIEFGLGAQNWFSTPTQASPMVSMSFVYRPKRPILEFFDRLMVSYAPVFTKTTTHQVSLGAQIDFDEY